MEKKPMTLAEALALEKEFVAPNYHPLDDVILAKAEGIFVWDTEGKKYFDFLSSYSACNQGHLDPRIRTAAIAQLEKMSLCSRAFRNDMLGPYAKKLCLLLGFEMMLPMNTGAEAVETALKLARRWGKRVKKIQEPQIITCEGNFHGRTIAICSMSSDHDVYDDFGPFTPGFIKIPYNNIPALEEVLRKNSSQIAAMILEPIQGEAGVVVPDRGYLYQVANLCKRYNVLLIIDEIQTGFGRTGKMLCCQHEGVVPDIVCVAKALSGGFYPISAVLASRKLLQLFNAGSHGSTYGGNPLACAIAMASLDAIVDDKLCEKSAEIGECFRNKLREIKSPLLEEVRGLGLMNAMVIKQGKVRAWDICLAMRDLGLLAKPTHEHIIRLTPPLCISLKQLGYALRIIERALQSLPK